MIIQVQMNFGIIMIDILNDKFKDKSMRKELILATAKAFIQENGSVTVLEIKEFLRTNYEDFYWKSDYILNTLLEQKENYNVEENGIFRLFKNKSNIEYCNMSQLAHIVNCNKGKFMTVVHKKQNGEENVMNCQILKQTDIGTYQVKERGNYKQFYPKDLIEVRFNKKIYKLK